MQHLNLRLLLLLCLACTPADQRDSDGDGFMAAVDCNDDDPNVFPGRTEVPNDGIDNDCDASTPDDDLDEDGIGSMEDCDDNDPLVRPGADETPYDGIDNDCDPTTVDDDLDEDGFGIATDCNDNTPGINPDAEEVFYDGVDNDCDLLTPDDDMDGDGVPVDEDCDDTSGVIRGENSYYIDCDNDGFSPGVEMAVSACAAPPAPTECPMGSWTLTEPVGAPFATDNSSVDCADGDPDVRPDQQQWFEISSLDLPQASRFDYDCNGAQETEFDLFTCSIEAGPNPGTEICVFDQGFETDVACGVGGNLLDQCDDSGASCMAASTSVETRRCR